MIFIKINEDDCQLIEQIALALHHEWSDFSPWCDVEQIRARLLARSHHESNEILCAYVDENNQLLATASTIYKELPEISYATWWLGEVLTIPAARGRKIGVQLIDRLYQEYHKNIHESLYLYTPDIQALYNRMGWVNVEECYVNNELVTIMKR